MAMLLMLVLSYRWAIRIIYLHRTHPMVEALAGYVMNTALDPSYTRICPTVRGNPHPSGRAAHHLAPYAVSLSPYYH